MAQVMERCIHIPYWIQDGLHSEHLERKSVIYLRRTEFRISVKHQNEEKHFSNATGNGRPPRISRWLKIGKPHWPFRSTLSVTEALQTIFVARNRRHETSVHTAFQSNCLWARFSIHTRVLKNPQFCVYAEDAQRPNRSKLWTRAVRLISRENI